MILIMQFGLSGGRIKQIRMCVWQRNVWCSAWGKIVLLSSKGIYSTCSKTRLTENVFPLTPALTLKHN